MRGHQNFTKAAHRPRGKGGEGGAVFPFSARCGRVAWGQPRRCDVKRLLGAGVVALLLAAGGAQAEEEMHLLLQLERLVDGAVRQSVALYGTAIDPNVSSIDDRFRLEVNGKPVAAPQALLARLARERRGYSYDYFTKGISESTRQALCMMAGPALGDRLSTLYLTYGKDQRDTYAHLRPVLSQPGNCLFAEEIAPKDAQAAQAAAQALASLQVILEMQGE